MANTYEQIMAMLKDAQGKPKNMMGLSNTITRDNGIPLDYSSVQKDYASALTYAKSATAYIGQPISVGDTLYLVTDEANGWLKPVGIKPKGDNSSIIVDDDGSISIYGFETALETTLPCKNSDGTLTWTPITALVEKDGNEKTRIVAGADSDIVVTPTYDSVNDTYTYTLDVKLPVIPEYTVTKETATGKTLYKVTKDGIQVGETIEVPNAHDDSDLRSQVSKAKTDIALQENRLATVEAFFKGADADGKDTEDGKTLYDALDTLKEIQDYLNGDGTAAGGIVDRVADNEETLDTLTGDKDTEGSILQIVDAAINEQNTAIERDYALKADLAIVRETINAAASKTYVDEALALKADKTELTNYYNKDSSYSKDEIDAKLAGIKGEYGETADTVAGDLQAHMADSSAKFTELTNKNNTQDEDIAANTEAIEAINDTENGILAQATVEISQQIQNLVNNGKVSENAAAIASVDSKLTNTNNNVTGLTSRVGALEQEDTNIKNTIASLTSAHNGLNETVAGNTIAIQGLQNKNVSIEAAIAANTARFSEYTNTQGMNKAIDDAIAELNLNIEVIEKNISDNTAAIEAEVTRAEAREAEIASLVYDNTAEIARVNSVLETALDNNTEGLDSIKELATWIAEHDNPESGILADINANTEAIATLTGTGEGSIQKIVADAIETNVATGTTAGTVKASEEISVASDGTMSVGYINTDKLVQGNRTLVLNGGSAEITA